MQKNTITWPNSFNPKYFPVHAYNELFIPARPEKIWDILINANRWPEWYKNSKKIKIGNGKTILEAGTEFEWVTFYLKVKSKVLIYNPPFDLGWDAKEFAANGFHGWKLIPQNNGTLVVTEEVQKGWGARLLKPIIVKSLQHWHQKWLEGMETLTKIKQ